MPSDAPRDLGRFDAIVLGGGPAGLSAAWELGLQGARALVVEREDDTGGLCRTHVREGYRFDMGGHRFISADRELLDRATALLGDELLLAERTSEVALLGQRFRYPLELPDLARKLPPGLALRALASYLRHRLRPGKAPESFEDWATRRFGRVLYELFLGPYTEKVWGVPPDQLSPEWAPQRISFHDLGEVARALLRRRDPAPPRTYAKSFLYPRLGIGQLFQAARAAAEAEGAQVLVGAVPRALEREGARVTGVLLETPDGLARARAEWVLSTIPLSALLSLVGAPALASTLRFRPVRFLNLGLRAGEVLPTTWRYVGESRLRAGRLQEPNKRSLAMAPAGRSSLMIEIPHAPGDAVDRQGDAELLLQMRGELRELGVPLEQDPPVVFSVRAPEAYPVHLRGVDAARDAALAAVDALENLRSFGRQGGFRFVFSDAAMRMGLEAARGVSRGAPPGSRELARIASARTLTEVASVVGR
ncbi:MAG: FAD-dependent oxidoreductase [Planctomycetota bacterium]